MTNNEAEIAASIGAIKAVMMSLLHVAAVNFSGEDENAQRKFLDDIRDVTLSGWNLGNLDKNDPEIQDIAHRVPQHIAAMFNNINVSR